MLQIPRPCVGCVTRRSSGTCARCHSRRIADVDGGAMAQLLGPRPDAARATPAIPTEAISAVVAPWMATGVAEAMRRRWAPTPERRERQPRTPSIGLDTVAPGRVS